MQITANAVFIKNNKILLEKRRKDEDNYADIWAIPGGHKKNKEQIKKTLIREMKEEMHIIVKKARPLGVFKDVDPTSKKIYHHHAFLVSEWEHRIKKTFEQKALRWFNMKKLPKNLRDVDKKIIKQLKYSL